MMKTSTLLKTVLLFFLSSCLFSDAYAQVTFPFYISGPTLVCEGSTHTYCLEGIDDFNGSVATPPWEIAIGGSISYTAEGLLNNCIEVTWYGNNTTGKVSFVVLASLKNSTDLYYVPIYLDVTIISDNQYISGPSIACRNGVLNNVYEVQPTGSTTSANWSISPSAGVTINGSGGGVILMFDQTTQTGTQYTLSAEVLNSCGETITIGKVITLSDCNGGGFRQQSDRKIGQNDLLIFPNPVPQGQSLHVKSPEESSSGEISIWSIDGRLLSKKSLGRSKISFSTATLSPGLYLIKMVTQGKESVKKFMVIE